MRLGATRDLVDERGLELSRRGSLEIGVGRNLDLGDDRGDLGPRFPERLSGLARDEVGEGLFAASDFIGETAQRLDPERDAVRRPFRPGGARGPG